MKADVSNANIDVGKTIIEQIGGNKIRVMWGIVSFMLSGEKPELSFRFKAKAKNKSNYVKITLNGHDLYDVEFGRIYANKYTVISTHEDIYAEDLKYLLFNETQLYTSLGIPLARSTV